MNKVSPLTCGILAGTLALGTYLPYYALKFGLDHPPSATGDEPEYDSLGWELALGQGFRVDYTNAEFRAPYEAAAEESELYRLGTTTRVAPITNRPPLFPYVMSLTNRLFGRQYWGIRGIDALSMAVICGMLVTMVCGSVGGNLLASGGRQSSDALAIQILASPARMLTAPGCVAAITVFLYVVVDTRTRLYGRAILTEALAALEVAILCTLLFRFADRPTMRQAVGMGVLLGVALLTRTQLILWLPGLMLIVLWLAFRRSPGNSTAVAAESSWIGARRLSAAAIVPGIIVAVALIVAAPWMVRNCRVLGEFMPLGSQGWVQLSAAFGDSVWEHHGLWTNLASEGFYDDVLTPDMSPVEADVAMAHYSRRRAVEWIATHPGRAIALVPLKIWQEFRPRTIPEGIILALSIIGAVLAWRDLRARILLAVVLSCCVSIAATWSVEGRFIVPLLFAQHGLIGLGLVNCTGKRLSTSRAW